MDPPVPHPDRFTTFRPRDQRGGGSRPWTVSRITGPTVEQRRYSDGGRLLRSTGEGNAPGRGELGLVDLAAARLGGSDGHRACNPYRDFRAGGQRHLILLVDTSSSVVLKRHAPDTVICAAGAALAALRRGHDVTVINFSSVAYRYGPTRDMDVVYDALSFQGQGTVLPRQALGELQVEDPWDLVLITDAAIHNLEQTLPAYASALKGRSDLRAVLFYFGDEALDGVAMLVRIGFRAQYVEGG